MSISPVAALLRVVNLVDYDIMLLFAIRRDVERGEPGFAAVLSAPVEKVEGIDCFSSTILCCCLRRSVMPSAQKY